MSYNYTIARGKINIDFCLNENMIIYLLQIYL